ncbi:MAG TPA: hypothetical protein VN715_01950 [Roseiarcus sp.]|nr:hypothetical protein [Roseiarcus sp.]
MTTRALFDHQPRAGQIEPGERRRPHLARLYREGGRQRAGGDDLAGAERRMIGIAGERRRQMSQRMQRAGIWRRSSYAARMMSAISHSLGLMPDGIGRAAGYGKRGILVDSSELYRITIQLLRLCAPLRLRRRRL